MLNTRRSFFKALGVGVLGTFGAVWPVRVWGCWRHGRERFCAESLPAATYATIAGPSQSDNIAGGGGVCVWGSTDGDLRAEASWAGAPTPLPVGTPLVNYATSPDPIYPCDFCVGFKLPPTTVGKSVTVNIYPASGTTALATVTFNMKALPVPTKKQPSE